MEKRTMKFINCNGFGDVSVLQIAEREIPVPKEGEVLLKVVAFGINRLDIPQRKGTYQAPKGASDILGVEASGYIVNPTTLEPDQSRPVMALLVGGGYAEYVTVPKTQLMDVPKGISVEDAAAIPEAWITSYLITRRLGGLKAGEKAFIYAAASGVGTATIQLVERVFGGDSIAVCSGEDKVAYLKGLGAKLVLDRQNKEQDPVQEVRKFAGDAGIDLVLDCVGPTKLNENVSMLKVDGRIILYGILGGGNSPDVNFGPILAKRISIISTTLRTRSEDFKNELIEAFAKEILGHFETKTIVPVIAKKFNLSWSADAEPVRQAHALMESNTNIGKILVTLSQ
eukprot:TRINITY_DN8571_c0_g4_i1.p1 TRINITY_DN8571_c0_g4~~TRINITY_DN8571_c0_g4_i1.p1  ORF type:complete len:341 (+),score=103.01 TRINITY_DN8571_c0_g4_i1:123-1145(+)